MQSACGKVRRMPHVQIRNVPPELHRRLKVRAASAGMSLSDYLLQELRRSAEAPTMDEFLAAVRKRPRIRSKRSSGDLIREDRDAA